MALLKPTAKEWAIATRNSTSSNIRVWEILADSLGEPQTFSGPGTQILAASLRPDNELLVFGQTSSPYLVSRTFDPETGELGDNAAITGAPDTIPQDTAWSADGSLFAVGHNRDGSGDFADQTLSLFSHEAGEFTLLDTADLSDPVDAVGISPDGRWLIAESDTTGVNSWIRVFEIVADALVQRGQLQLDSVGEVVGVHWLSDSSRAIVSRSGSGSMAAWLVEVSNDGTPTEVAGPASISAPSGSVSLSKDERYLLIGGAATPAGEVNELANDEFTELATVADVQVRHPEWNTLGDLFVGASASDVRLFSWDGESIELLETSEWSSTIGRLLVTRWPLELDEEAVFNATYADASGRDPLPTMLVDGPSCQRAINTYARFWASVGDPLAVPAFVGLGKLSLVEQGQVIKVQSTRHAIGLEVGRAALVMRPRIDPRSGTCELTVQPNKEDLES